MSKRALVVKRQKPILILGGIFFTLGITVLSSALYVGITEYNKGLRFEREGQVVTGEVVQRKRTAPA
jgi:hypothetical protein